MTEFGKIYEERAQKAADRADALRLVDSINRAAKKLGSVAEACALMDYSEQEYNDAVKLLESEKTAAIA